MTSKKRLKFLMVSNIGVGSNIAYMLKKEGNDVKMYIQNPEERDVADGVIEKTDDWEKEKHWADIIIFDDTFFGFRQNELRKEGFKVIGGSYLGDQLELDRKFAVKYFRKMDVKIPKTYDFEGFGSAMKFLRANKGRRYIIKFEGIASDEKDLVYMAQLPDNSDLLKVMDHYAKNWNSYWGHPTFVLQEIVEGVEVAVTAWFNGERFLMPVFVNFECKRFLTGNLGMMTGDMGGHGFFTSEKLELFNRTLKKVESDLRRDGYVGCVDVNCIVNDRGIWPLEFTCRFGYPTINIQFEAIKDRMRVTDLFAGLVDKSLRRLDASEGFQVGVVVNVPTFPYAEGFERYGKGLPIIIMDGSVKGHFHIGDLKQENGSWVAGGSVGYGVIITGSGKTVAEAKSEVYKNIGKIIVPNAIYRIDVSDRWENDRRKLMEYGYL